MKKIVAILLAVLMMIPAFALGENVVKIGVFEPASGDSGAGGKQEMLGMQYANSVQPTVEIGGETYTVELVYADNRFFRRQGAFRCAAAGQRGRERGAGLLWLRRVHRGLVSTSRMRASPPSA